MATEIKKPVAEEIKFLGKKATKTITKDGVVIDLRKAEYDSLLEEKGITEEVVKSVTTGLQEIASDAIVAAKDISIKSKGQNVHVRLGKGSLSQEIEFIARRETNRRNPATNEPIHKIEYGVVKATLNLPWGKAMKGDDGVLVSVGKEMDDFFNKKK